MPTFTPFHCEYMCDNYSFNFGLFVKGYYLVAQTKDILARHAVSFFYFHLFDIFSIIIHYIENQEKLKTLVQVKMHFENNHHVNEYDVRK